MPTEPPRTSGLQKTSVHMMMTLSLSLSLTDLTCWTRHAHTRGLGSLQAKLVMGMGMHAPYIGIHAPYIGIQAHM